MDDKKYNTWDILVKLLGFVATTVTICVGFYQFNTQRQSTSELEFNRSYWQSQNQVYFEVCNNAGAMAAMLQDSLVFKKDSGVFYREKQKFLTQYYGNMVLVEDRTVDSIMKEMKSLLGILNPRNHTMVYQFDALVLALSEACKNSSAVFKQKKLE